MTFKGGIAILVFGLAASAQASPPAAVFTQSPVGKLVRTERRTPFDLAACKQRLWGDGGATSFIWSCEFGEAVWDVDTYFVDNNGVRRRHTVQEPDGYHESDNCNVIMEVSTNGYELEARGNALTRDQAEACLDRAVADPASPIKSPIVEVWDYPENVALPGPQYPGSGNPIYYTDVVIGVVGQIIDFTYTPAYTDFESVMKFEKGYTGCEAGFGCAASADGVAALSPANAPLPGDFEFAAYQFSQPAAKGCTASFKWDRSQGQLTWDETDTRFSPLLPPFKPGKGDVESCAKKFASGPALRPTIRVFRYDPPYQPPSSR
jgi:hypothetical protein